jgi:hypothetical protein
MNMYSVKTETPYMISTQFYDEYTVSAKNFEDAVNKVNKELNKFKVEEQYKERIAQVILIARGTL